MRHGGAIAAGLILLAGCKVPAGASTVPSGGALAPYRMAEIRLSAGSPEPMRLIATPADCDPILDAWTRQVCVLVLRADWRDIALPTDPRASQGDFPPATWIAAMTRAAISGDQTICSSQQMDLWFRIPTTAGPPPNGETPDPPTECLAFLDAVAKQGTFRVPNGAGRDIAVFEVSAPAPVPS